MKRLLLVLGLLACVVPASAQTVVFRDTMTEACETCTIELSTHVPDSCGAWHINENTGTPDQIRAFVQKLKADTSFVGS